MKNNTKIRYTALMAMGSLCAITTLYRIYLYLTADGPMLGVVSAAVLSASSFYWARHYAKLVESDSYLTQLITRSDDVFTFKGTPQSGHQQEKGIELEAHRLSILSIRDNYLSVIVDGNGNGWDFFVMGSANDIERHIRSLLSNDEQSNIKFKRV